MYKPLSQVCDNTGISEDYWNEWSFRVSMLCFPSDGERLFRSLRERPIRRYTEQFHVNDWDVDLCNFRVGALDRLADEVNRRATDNSLDARAFFHLARCAYYFIHGCRDHAADVVLNDLERMFG